MPLGLDTALCLLIVDTQTLFYFSGIAVMTLLYAQHDTTDGEELGQRGLGQSGERQASSRQHPPTSYGESMVQKTVPY